MNFQNPLRKQNPLEQNAKVVLVHLKKANPLQKRLRMKKRKRKHQNQILLVKKRKEEVNKKKMLYQRKKLQKQSKKKNPKTPRNPWKLKMLTQKPKPTKLRYYTQLYTVVVIDLHTLTKYRTCAIISRSRFVTVP